MRINLHISLGSHGESKHSVYLKCHFMISVEYKTDLGPVIAKGLNEIRSCLNTIYSSRTCGQTLQNLANRAAQSSAGKAFFSDKLQNEILV